MYVTFINFVKPKNIATRVKNKLDTLIIFLNPRTFC